MNRCVRQTFAPRDGGQFDFVARRRALDEYDFSRWQATHTTAAGRDAFHHDELRLVTASGRLSARHIYALPGHGD